MDLVLLKIDQGKTDEIHFGEKRHFKEFLFELICLMKYVTGEHSIYSDVTFIELSQQY